ncbi:hypothetical protein BRARA_G01314 [Brassica rapa]|uniref:Sec23/Sec24 trunk domain-containing protein n=1 Tax=Brassica campestris TaxID=3711 RepID=A0A397YT07_BRACM|nr:hypothetical protein BRARA_G01314 [Brassica rapa]
MAVRATVSRFPIDSDALEASGLPWGLTVTPFAAKDENGIAPARGSNGHLLPRCENCYAYFNTYCELDQWAWNCSLCGTLNGLPSDAIARYSNPHSIPEMSSSFIDLELPLDGSEEEMTQARPVYVAAIDLSSSEEFLELTKSSLLAALEALSPGSLFGLATFSHKIGLYDVQGPVPVVKNVFIPPDAESKLPLELEDAMPLLQFLAPVETCKDRIAAALETLRPITSWERSSGAAQGMDGVSQIDITFSQCPQLEPLPRLVFALLRNPLLRFHEEGVHPDYRIYLQCLFSVLEPSALHCGIYPSLMSYSTPDKQAYPRHSLSRAALMTSGSPIFFLDAYTTLIVFYSSTADPSLPFPPPQDCLLRKTINEVKQGRSITPKLMFIRGGQDDATAFENYLIEEQDVDGSGFASAMGFVAFLDDISQSVAEYMK